MSAQFVDVAGDEGRTQRVPIENMTPMRNGDDARDVRRLVKSESGRRASAVATADLVSSLAIGGTPLMRENAARVLNELELPEEAQVSSTEVFLPAGVEHPAPAVEPVAAIPTDYELPDDLAELLDEPDDEPELVDYVPQVEDDDGYADPQVAALRKQVAAAEKKADHERKLRVQASRTGWEAEAARVFRLGEVPLLDPAELAAIKADSRKDFLRQAKARADQNKLVAARFNPTVAVQAETVDVDALVEERARQLEAERWGNAPGGGTPAAPAESVAQQEALARARRKGNLKDMIKARIYPE